MKVAKISVVLKIVRSNMGARAPLDPVAVHGRTYVCPKKAIIYAAAAHGGTRRVCAVNDVNGTAQNDGVVYIVHTHTHTHIFR